MPDVGRTEPLIPVWALDKIAKFDVPPPLEFQSGVVDSMSPPHIAECVSAQDALAHDRVTLRFIDDDIEDCRMRIARTQARIRSLERQRDAVQRRISIHRARLSPLRVVPDQILQEIFQHCLPDMPFIVPDVRTAPVVLTHVCRRWRTVAQGTSELWSSIALFDRGIWNHELRLDMAKRWLERSRTRPLRMSITCPPHTDFGLDGNPSSSDVFRLATTHSAQLSELCLSANRTYLRHLMDRARLPALRSLVIALHAVHRTDEPAEPGTPPVLSAPRLQRIAFKGSGASIDLIPRALMPQITHLAFDCSMTLDLARLLHDFAHLERLTLALSHARDALRIQRAPSLGGDRTRRTVSPMLTHLEIRLDADALHAGDPGPLEAVLDQLELPALQALVLAAPLQPRFDARTRRAEARWEHYPAWIGSPSIGALLARSRHPCARFEARDLAAPSPLSSEPSVLLRTGEVWVDGQI